MGIGRFRAWRGGAQLLEGDKQGGHVDEGVIIGLQHEFGVVHGHGQLHYVVAFVEDVVVIRLLRCESDIAIKFHLHREVRVLERSSGRV